MTLTWEHCPTGGVFIVSKLKKKDKQNLTLMTPFGNVVSWPKIWLIILPWEHCPTGSVFIVAKLKQIQAKSNPNDSHLGTLSVGQNVVNDSPFGALSRWRRVYCSQIKTNTSKI